MPIAQPSTFFRGQQGLRWRQERAPREDQWKSYWGFQAMDYRTAGVDVVAGRAFVERIRSSVDSTRRPEVVGGLGGFEIGRAHV